MSIGQNGFTPAGRAERTIIEGETRWGVRGEERRCPEYVEGYLPLIKTNMSGVITDRNWKAIERTFPGIHRFYLVLPRKPKTFLELLECYFRKGVNHHASPKINGQLIAG